VLEPAVAVSVAPVHDRAEESELLSAKPSTYAFIKYVNTAINVAVVIGMFFMQPSGHFKLFVISAGFLIVGGSFLYTARGVARTVPDRLEQAPVDPRAPRGDRQSIAECLAEASRHHPRASSSLRVGAANHVHSEANTGALLVRE
jgi:hypothetical protein